MPPPIIRTTYGNGEDPPYTLIGNNFTVTSSATATYSPNVLGWSTGGIQTGSHNYVSANTTWTTITYDVRPINHGQVFQPPSVPEMTEEETERQRRRHEHFRERQREHQRIRDEASARARELLFRFLTDEQRESYESALYFETIGSLGTRFRIKRNTMANIEILDSTGAMVAALCAHPRDDSEWLPEADKHLGQLLAIQNDEREIMRVANCHRGVRPVYEDDRMVV